jgi:hypothetical protein
MFEVHFFHNAGISGYQFWLVGFAGAKSDPFPTWEAAASAGGAPRGWVRPCLPANPSRFDSLLSWLVLRPFNKAPPTRSGCGNAPLLLDRSARKERGRRCNPFGAELILTLTKIIVQSNHNFQKITFRPRAGNFRKLRGYRFIGFALVRGAGDQTRTVPAGRS